MHLPAATIRTQVMLPLRFADEFGTTAWVYTFDGLADCREALASSALVNERVTRGGPSRLAGSAQTPAGTRCAFARISWRSVVNSEIVLLDTDATGRALRPVGSVLDTITTLSM